MSHRLLRILIIVATMLSASAATADDATELAKRGEQLYVINCSRCHGIQLVNPVGWSFDLRQFPIDQPARFFNSVSKGKGNMPAWGDLLKPEQIQSLWEYVHAEAKRNQEQQ